MKTYSQILKIAITGPESTGKSELAKSLAKHFNTVWVHEFARDYINNLDRPYTFDDILQIAKGQERLIEESLAKASGFLFCDTELLVTKIWCEYKYGKCPAWILDNYKKQNFDLYLLMNIDLPWQPDPQREHPHKREELFKLYKSELETFKKPFKIVSGVREYRLKNAIDLVENLF